MAMASAAAAVAGDGSRRRDYRGTCVEDLQIPPAVCLPADARLRQAIELAYEREFDILPVLENGGNKRPLGYLAMAELKRRPGGEDDQVMEQSVLSRARRFESRASKGYTLITPVTPLEVLDEFLERHTFALITDARRRHVLGLVTREDLDKFWAKLLPPSESSRPLS